ncbi:MAG: OmpA family protein [Bacteroidia bacterium]
MINNYDFEKVLKNRWKYPGSGSTDLRKEYNDQGKNKFIGFIPFAAGIKALDYGEYAQNKLNVQLDSGECYKLSFEIRIDKGSKYLVNHIEFAFTKTKLEGNSDASIINRHEVVSVFRSDSSLIDNKKWERIETYFIAESKAEFVTFGIFNPNLEIIPKNKNIHSKVYSYYNIDNLVLEESFLEECKCDYNNQSNEKVIAANVNIGKNAIINNLQFELGSADISSTSLKELSDIANYLVTNDIKIEIHGYTDSIGGDSQNVQLSIKRAEAIKRHLMKNGVLELKISVYGHGSANPISKELEKNRRVELIIVK